MLSWREMVEEDVMLWAHSHELSDLIHLFKEVHIIAGCSACRFLNETSEHRDRCRLASAIVAEQGEDLVLVHLHVDASDSLEASREGLLQVVNLEVLVGHLKALAHDWWCLIVVLGHLSALKLIIILIVSEHVG